MDLLARSGKVEERCPSGLHIGIVFPSLSKKQMVLEILDNNQDFKKLVSIHFGAATEKALCYRSPFNGENTSFSDFLKDHLSKDTSSRILITAPCVDLALAIKQSNCFTTINKIEEIFWAGGFHEENTETIVAYNWKRNISATQSILEIAELRFKTTIVTRASHPYGWKIDSRSFPGLIEKVADVYNVYNGHAAKVQVTDIMAETGFLSYRDTSIFGDDLVATMLMFYPELIQEKRMVKYELQEVKSDEPVLISKKSQARKRRKMKHKKDKEEKERKKVKDRMRMPRRRIASKGRYWKNVTDIMAETGFLSYRDTSIFGDDLVATMLMFYPELIQEKRMVKYELQEVKSDEPVLISKKSQARKRRKMKHKKDKEEKERKKVKDRMRMPRRRIASKGRYWKNVKCPRFSTPSIKFECLTKNPETNLFSLNIHTSTRS
ncbi:hypothetical protein ABG067_004832 [Albugo candida]